MTQSTADIEVTETLDCTGLLCPLPVYQAGMVLQRLVAGDVLKLVTTDPGALEDIPALARQRGDTLLASVQDDNTQAFWLKKGS